MEHHLGKLHGQKQLFPAGGMELRVETFIQKQLDFLALAAAVHLIIKKQAGPWQTLWQQS